MEAIVLAGDLGERPAHIGFDVPKPMAPVDGLPFLEYVLVDLIENGVDRIVIAVNHKKEMIMQYFGDVFRGVPVVYSVEDVPLKTGGAVKHAIWHCSEERVIVVDGNTLFKVPLKEMHKFAVSKDVPVVVAVKEMFNFSKYERVVVNAEGIVTQYLEKEPCRRGYINGGVYSVARTALDKYPDIFSMEEFCFPRLLKKRKLAAFISNTFFIDIGTPEDYVRAQKDLAGYHM